MDPLYIEGTKDNLSEVQLHPVVLFSILDHYLRREESGEKVIGALLGSVGPGGVVNVTNSFGIFHKATQDEILVKSQTLRDMLELHRRADPNEILVGWYSTWRSSSSINSSASSSNSSSDLMNIKTLEKEYNSVLKQYEEAYKNCNAKLSAATNTTTPDFTSFPNNSFWGQNGLKEGSVASEFDCETMCASDEKCSGATYNPDKKYCWTRTGNGSLDVSVNGNTQGEAMIIKTYVVSSDMTSSQEREARLKNLSIL
jgi:hypothetical protein